MVYNYSKPILASSPIPQSDSLGRGGRSSSLCVAKLLVRLFTELFFKLSVLKPEPLLLVLFVLFPLSKLFTLSSYPGAGAEVLAIGESEGSGLASRRGVGDGVISVLGDTSTSSASLYHFRLLVYLPHPS
jgi:hypothetical protein